MSDAVITLGRDCACGHPLVVRGGIEVCAVYGTHPDVPATPAQFGVHRRLVSECIAAAADTRRARYAASRRLQAVS